MIKNGANINYKDFFGFSAIFYALKFYKEFFLIEFLLKKKAKIDFLKTEGFNILVFAIFENMDSKIFKLLFLKIIDSHFFYFFLRCKLNLIHFCFIINKEKYIDILKTKINFEEKCFFGWKGIYYKTWKNRKKTFAYNKIFLN